MKNISLRNLGWFSFTSDLVKLKHLSIYQAIAYVLRKEAVLVLEVNDYEKNIHALEVESAGEIYEHYGEATNNYSANTFVMETDYQEICIPETEIPSDVNLLNENRINLIDHIGAPFPVIYTLLLAEICKHESNSSLLDIQKIEKEDVISYLIGRKTLDNWKSMSAIKELGLLNPDSLPKSVARIDKSENEKKTAGMLLHLLVNLSLEDKRGPVVFTFDSDSTNIAYDRIYKYFCDNYLETSDSEFPSTNTVKNNLKAAYSLFKTTVRCK